MQLLERNEFFTLDKQWHDTGIKPEGYNEAKAAWQEATTIKFEEGNIYEMRFIGDSDLRPQWICTKRTAKTVTFERFKSTESITRRVKMSSGHTNYEYILDGSYSMAPSINADKIVG